MAAKRSSLMSDLLSPMRTHAAIVIAVFLVFVLNALGVIQFPQSINQAVKFSVRGFPTSSAGLDFAVFLITGSVLALSLPRLDPVKASILAFVAMLLPYYVEYARIGASRLIPLEYTLLTILVLFSVNVLIKYFIDTREKEKLISMFGAYVPPEVVRRLNRNPESFSLRGEARELSVLFCDIRRFSNISEQLDSRQLAQLLNLYFTEFTDVLHQHGATIDKYMGDAIMAFWGAPLRQADHPERALNAALATVAALERLNERFRKLELPAIDIGIGINTGTMHVGNMGSRFRVAYTVVGDAVNLGARLEGLTRIYDAKIIVSETTKLANPEIAFRELDHVRVKGKGLATRIYEPIGPSRELSEEEQRLLAKHERALNAYYESDWPSAEALFGELDREVNESKYYVLMRSRVLSHQQHSHDRFDGITNYNPEMSIGSQ